MIFQDPFASLHPMYRVGDQLVEAVLVHEDMSKSAAREKVVDMLSQVGIPNPRERFRDYPHQYSGGMRQRAMIAMALLHKPDILIADEPTTALDVTVQAQILELIAQIKNEFNIGVILITHDLSVIADVAQTVMVMYAGRASELAPKDELFDAPLHPYTWGLLESIPEVSQKGSRLLAIEGSPPSLINPPSGLLVPPALSAPLLAVRRGRAGVQGPGRRAPGVLPPDDRGQAPHLGRARGAEGIKVAV